VILFGKRNPALDWTGRVYFLEFTLHRFGIVVQQRIIEMIDCTSDLSLWPRRFLSISKLISIYLSQPISISLCLSVCLPLSRFINLFIHLFIYLLFYLSIYLFIYLFIYLYLSQSTNFSICLHLLSASFCLRQLISLSASQPLSRSCSRNTNKHYSLWNVVNESWRLK
jgi:hypothetical protein